MHNQTLFLGFPLESDLSISLSGLDPSLLDLFIKENQSDYLQKIIYNEVIYLGKLAGDVTDLTHLTLLEENIRSILKKLLPHTCQEKISLILFSIPS